MTIALAFVVFLLIASEQMPKYGTFTYIGTLFIVLYFLAVVICCVHLGIIYMGSDKIREFNAARGRKRDTHVNAFDLARARKDLMHQT